MKITGIIGFIIMLLGDGVLFFTAMDMPAGSKVSKVLLLFALTVLILSIVYFIAAIKRKNTLVTVTSILLIISPVITFILYKPLLRGDMNQYGKYFNPDMPLKIYTMLGLASIVFGILGIIFSLIEKKNK